MENKIAIGSLSSILSRSCGKSKKLCEDFLREFFRVVADALEQGETVKIKGLGTFKLSDVESRNSVSVNTGEPIEIAPHKKVVFSPAKEIASAINSPFEDFESIEIDDEMTADLLMDSMRLNEDIEPDGNKEIEENNVSNENLVSVKRLEEGSDEEGEDDEITYEAYNESNIKNQQKEEIIQQEISEEKPVSVESNNLENNDSAPVSTNIHLPVFYEPPKKNRFGMGFLIGALSSLVVCVVIFMLGCFFDWWPENFDYIRNNNIETEQTVSEIPESVEDNPIVEEPEPEPIYDTVSTTRYLTTIARDHYGNYNLWPYIYLENESILGHPDRITPGTQVVVPDLSKYGVDPSNKQDIEDAKRKAIEIYARFK